MMMMIMITMIITMVLITTRMIPIEVALLKVISHGDDVHKLQQPEPVTLVHVTDRVSLRLVIGLSSIVVVVDDVDGDD
jgi:hypothetical protein